jgi:hypothetical protein
MADQIEIPKLVEYIAIGPKSDEISVTKLVMYVLAIPGEGDDGSNKQGHVHAQIFKRRR